jgi:hypothetical protein
LELPASGSLKELLEITLLRNAYILKFLFSAADCPPAVFTVCEDFFDAEFKNELLSLDI